MTGEDLYRLYNGKRGKDRSTKAEGIIVGYSRSENYAIAKVTKAGKGILSEGWTDMEDGDFIKEEHKGNELGYIYVEEDEIIKI